jgi:putative cell wall-binding protein/beta-lactamase superfamily II metal-dependent hydrolase
MRRRSTAVAVVLGLLFAVVATVPESPVAEAATGTNIVVLGGSSAVSDAVVSRLATCTSGSVTRIAGANRYATAAAVSSTFLNPGIDVAYVATGENFPDALAGSAAAGAGTGGPVLLVRSTSVPAETAAELNRLNPKIIVVLGGMAAISTEVESALRGYGTVVRIAGANRYSTGALVSEHAFPTGANTAYVATGSNFPDALAGGPAAVGAKGPMLLVEQNNIPSSVGTELARLGLSSIKVLGGTAAVSGSVAAELTAYAATVTRLSGANRYATAVAVSKNTFAPGVETIFVATGQNFPDALAGGPVAGILGGPILLVEKDSIPADTEGEIERLTGGTCTDIAPSGDLLVQFIPVRQGDATIYQGPCGDIGLIDTNRYRQQEVLDALDTLGTRSLKWISVSHYDADHLGGVLPVATASGVSVGAVYDRGGARTAKDSQTYRDYYDWVTNAGLRHPVDIGDTFSLCSGVDQVTFTVMSAGTDGTAAGGVAVSEENDRGLCLKAEFADFDLVTCGDINGTNDGSRTDVETAVAATMGDVEVAKINHHGSSYSSNATWVNTLNAEASVVFVGANSYGHPNAAVLARWATTGTVFQTQSPIDNAMIDGTITVTTDGVTAFHVAASHSTKTITAAVSP